MSFSFQVSELFQAIRQEAAYSQKNSDVLDEVASDWCPHGSKSFEVSHVANVRCPGTKASVTFLDDVLNKLHKGPQQGGRSRRKSDSSVPTALRTLHGIHTSRHDDTLLEEDHVPEIPQIRREFKAHKSLSISGEDNEVHYEEKGPSRMRRPRASTGPVLAARVALLVIGRQDVKLISLDKKALILERRFKDISFCLKVSTKSAEQGWMGINIVSKFGAAHNCKC